MTIALTDFAAIKEAVAQRFGDDPYCETIQDIYTHWLRKIHPEYTGTDEMIGALTDDLVWKYTFPTDYELRVMVESGPESGLPPRLIVVTLDEFDAERTNGRVPDHVTPDAVIGLSTYGYTYDETIPPWWFSVNGVLQGQIEAMYDTELEEQLLEKEEGPELERWISMEGAFKGIVESFCRYTLGTLCTHSQQHLLDCIKSQENSI